MSTPEDIVERQLETQRRIAAQEARADSEYGEDEDDPPPEIGPCVLIEGHNFEAFAKELADRLGAMLISYRDPPQGNPTDAMAHYFGPLALALTGRRPVVCRNAWVGHDADSILGVGRRRMLERAALALGVKAVRPLSGAFVRDPVGTLPTCWIGHQAVDGYLQQAHGSRYPNRGPGSGAWRPDHSILLVGDRPNSAKHGDLKHRLPFFSKHAGGCSLWLAEQLEAAGVPETDLYWINAYDMFEHPTHAEFLNRLRPRKVIALGTEAAKWCVTVGCLQPSEVTLVPHPQFWKRFRAGERYALLDALAGATT